MSENQKTKKLLKMKDLIEDKKALKNRLEGQIDQIKKKLKEQFGCKTAGEVKAKLVAIASKIEVAEGELADELEILEKDFIWE